jgi:hypothetical protein
MPVKAAIAPTATPTCPGRPSRRSSTRSRPAGRLAFPVDRVYDGLEQVPQAHDDMEHDRATGKLVVRVRH